VPIEFDAGQVRVPRRESSNAPWRVASEVAGLIHPFRPRRRPRDRTGISSILRGGKTCHNTNGGLSVVSKPCSPSAGTRGCFRLGTAAPVSTVFPTPAVPLTVEQKAFNQQSDQGKNYEPARHRADQNGRIAAPA
jgi:hypothetical protein